jgi:hypothetical protein
MEEVSPWNLARFQFRWVLRLSARDSLVQPAGE